MTYLEQKHQEIQFLRIDADVHDSLKDEVAEDEKEEFQKTADSLVEIFRKELNNDKLDVKVEKLKMIMSLPWQFSRAEQTYGRDDEDVRNGRHGSGYVRKPGNTGAERKPSACEIPCGA